MLLAQLLVIVLARAGFLKVANLNIDGGDFFIQVLEVTDVGRDTPIIKLSTRCNHGKELRVWAIDDELEPTEKRFDEFISEVSWGGIDEDNMRGVMRAIVGREGSVRNGPIGSLPHCHTWHPLHGFEATDSSLGCIYT
jgi:hypothetical protein